MEAALLIFFPDRRNALCSRATVRTPSTFCNCTGSGIYPRTSYNDIWTNGAWGSSNNDVSQRVGGRGWEEADALISVGGA